MNCERIEVTTTDGTAWLDRLSPRQMIAIGDNLYSQKKERLIKSMKEAEVDSAERMKELESLESRRGLMSEVIGYAVTSDGALDIISVASESPNAENAGGLPESFVGSSEEAMRIAIQLVGAEIESESSSKSKKKK